MSLGTDTPFTMPVVPASSTSGNGNGNGWGNDGSWWIIILFLFIFAGGWNRGGWGGNGNGGSTPSGSASCFNPAFNSAAAATHSFSVVLVTDTRRPSTMTLTFQLPDGSFFGFGSFIATHLNLSYIFYVTFNKQGFWRKYHKSVMSTKQPVIFWE